MAKVQKRYTQEFKRETVRLVQSSGKSIAQVAVWHPGGDLTQFKSLLSPLRLTEVSIEPATVVPSMTVEVMEVAHPSSCVAISFWKAEVTAPQRKLDGQELTKCLQRNAKH